MFMVKKWKMQVLPPKSKTIPTTKVTPTATDEQKSAAGASFPKISATKTTTAAKANSSTEDEKASAKPAAANTGVANSSESQNKRL